jgi:hypothetical protein
MFGCSDALLAKVHIRTGDVIRMVVAQEEFVDGGSRHSANQVEVSTTA